MAPQGNKSTAKISRDHVLMTSKSGLITITGGKWTTFRRMAHDAISEVFKQLSLPTTSMLPVIPVAGGDDYDQQKLSSQLSETIADQDIVDHLINYYGSRSLVIQELIKEKGLERLDSKYPFITAEVMYVCRYEMAMQAEDVLDRRFRLSFLDSKTSEAIKSKVATIVEQEVKVTNLA